MKSIYLFLVLVIVSCHSEEVIPDGKKIISIHYFDNPLGFKPKANEWEERIAYDNMGDIVKVTSIGLAVNSHKEFEYNTLGKVSQIFTYDSMRSKLFNRDSITYLNDFGHIDKVFHYSLNAGVPVYIYKYVYNIEGRIIQRESFSTTSNKNYFIEKYYWKDGNIERMEQFLTEPSVFLAYEFFYEYDRKINYKKNLPMYLDNPLSQTTNNVISESFNDYYGNLDLACPCTNEYKYNASSLPYIIMTSWGRKIEITYE